jgi:hypothetical protein
MRGSSVAFVVRAIASIPVIARRRAMCSTIPLRTSGSPPVRRILEMPSSTAAAAKRSISSNVSTVAGSLHGTPSGGMQ